MHADINNGIGTLTNLFPDDIVIQRSFCGKNDHLLLLLIDLLLSSYLILLVHRYDILSDSRYASCCVTGRGFLWSLHNIFHTILIDDSICCREDSSILLLIIMVSWLSALNYGSFYITIARILVCYCHLVFKAWDSVSTWIRCSCRWCLCLILWSTWLEEEVVYDHLSLVHVHGRHSSLVWAVLTSLGKHISLLLLQELHVFSRCLMRRYEIAECVYHRLSLIELLVFLSHASSSLHGSPSRRRHRIFLYFIRQCSFISSQLRLSLLLLLRLWRGSRSWSLQKGLRLLMFLDSYSHRHTLTIIARGSTCWGHKSASIWWKRLLSTESSGWHGGRGTGFLVNCVHKASIWGGGASTWPYIHSWILSVDN